MQNNHDDHRDDMAEAFHGIANETGRSEFVKAAKAAEEAFGEDATDPLGSETWDQLRASIAELEAQLAAERERAEKAERRADGCESNGPHSRQSLMQSLNLARDHEAALLAERDALREAVRVLGEPFEWMSGEITCRRACKAHDGDECTCGVETQMNEIRDRINANPIAAAAVKGEQGSSMCSSCGHEIALHGTNGCTVELDSAWTASNTKPCGCRNKPND